MTAEITTFPRLPTAPRRHGSTDKTRPIRRSDRRRWYDIAVERSPGRAQLAFTGALDFASSRDLEKVVDDLCNEGRIDLTVDVGGLTTLHCDAIGALSHAAQRARAAGGCLTLTDSTALARRVQTLLHPTETPTWSRHVRRDRDGLLASLMNATTPGPAQ